MKNTAPLNRFGAKYRNDSGACVYEKDWRKRENGQCHIAMPGEVYPYGYDPTFYPHRLPEPHKVKTGHKIFVVDTGDLFGEWVPKEWIEQVLSIAAECNWHKFIFLTKNPKRMLDFTFPLNSWVGTTTITDDDKWRADIIKEVKAPVRFLSIEPLHGPLTFDFDGLQWITVGAQTGRNVVFPDKKWVDGVLHSAADYKIPVFVKDNLKVYYDYADMKQFPGDIKAAD
jgi:protein gp37